MRKRGIARGLKGKEGTNVGQLANRETEQERDRSHFALASAEPIVPRMRPLLCIPRDKTCFSLDVTYRDISEVLMT